MQHKTHLFKTDWPVEILYLYRQYHVHETTMPIIDYELAVARL